MNLHVKSSLIIIVTLIIGMFLGIILTRSFLRPPKMIDRISELRSPKGFAERFERIIDPSESQKEKIQHILQSHFERMHNHSLKFRNEFMKLNDSLRADLDPILTDEQKKRLDKMKERMKEHERQGFGPRQMHPKKRNPDERKRLKN